MQHVIPVIALACAFITAPAYAGVGWTREKVAGLYMELLDPTRIEHYSFGRNGNVAVTTGSQSSRGTSFTVPLRSWKIENSRLQIFDDDGIREEFTLVSVSNSVITVRRRSGETARFHCSMSAGGLTRR